MKNIQRILLLILLSLACSCTSDFYEISDVIDDDPMKVTAILPDWNLEDVKTRTSITTGPYPTLPSPVWVTGDSIGIYPNAGGDQLSFRINEGGSKTCTFDGGGWAMTSASYTAYSPFKRSYYYRQKDALPISMLGQTQDGNDNAGHLGAYDIQIATGEKPETGSLIFSFSRKVALVRIEITAPKVATWTSVSLESDALFTTDAIMNLDLQTPSVTPITTSNSVTLNLKNVSTTRNNLSIIAYMMLLPVDLTGKSLSVKLTDNEGNTYSKEASITNNKTNFAANAARWVTADFEVMIPNNEIWYTSSDGNIIEPNDPSAFGTTIKSNICEDGKGVITFDNDVTIIGDMAFHSRPTLTSVSIPNSVGTIGKSAFYGCTSLKSVSIPDGVTYISESTFYNCVALESIVIPKDVTTIDQYAFNNCGSLSSVTFKGNKLTTIGAGAFTYCSSLETITIPDGVVSIGPSAFNSCTSLKSITIPENITVIESNTFSCCVNLVDVNLPEQLTTLREACFTKCSKLEEINIPESVTLIDGGSTFSGCISLKRVNLPSNLRELPAKVFDGCTSLKNINLPSKLELIGWGTFMFCVNLETITIPDAIQSLESHIFEGCSSLNDIILPKSLEVIGRSAFKGCI